MATSPVKGEGFGPRHGESRSPRGEWGGMKDNPRIKDITLEAGDRVEGSFTVTGGDNSLKFWVEDLSGNAIFAVPELVEDPISGKLADPGCGWASGTHSFGFTAAISGEYALVPK